MADVALRAATEAASHNVEDRAKALARFHFSDGAFQRLTMASAILVLLLLGGVILSLISGSIPVFREFGLGFITAQSWNPVTDVSVADSIRPAKSRRH